MPIKTVLVTNLPPKSTIEDIENHFESHLKGCDPFIGPIVPYLQRVTPRAGKQHNEERLSTTVTFRGDNDWKNTLDGRKFRPRKCADENSREVFLAYRDNFIGLYPIAQDIRITNPDFEFVFIHGLGGHAFHTWSYEKGGSTSGVKMWPRDFLEPELHKRQLDGRYWTFGYAADTTNRNPHAVKTINEASEQLLFDLDKAGFGDNSRPIYFACHSLGGLVLCNALNDALRPVNGKRPLKPHYEKMLMRKTAQGMECKVKGVIFFGTPFRGSVVANRVLLFKELGKYFNYNIELVKSLKSHSKELATIATCFNQVEEEHKIEPLIYYENRRLMSWRFVVGAKSARGAFTSNATPLDANHIQMIKFSSEKDRKFTIVLNDIYKLIRRAQQETRVATMTLNPFEDAKETKVSADDRKEVELQAVEEFAKQLLAAVSKYRKDNMASPKTTLQVNGSKWGRKLSTSSPNDTAIPPGTPTSSSNGIKKPAITFNDIKAMMDLEPANTLSPPPSYKQAEETLVSPLRKFHTIFILDDSGSMSKPVADGEEEFMSRWELLVESVRYFGDIAAQSDDDGVDIKFVVNGDKNAENIRSGQHVLDLLADINIQPNKPSSLDSVLWDILGGYIQGYEQYKVIKDMKFSSFRFQVQLPKPLNLIVITDGVSHDYEKIEEVLSRAARSFEDLEMQEFQVGVQFVQVGNDKNGKKRLRLLDDKLPERYGVRDICDSRSFDRKAFEGIQKQELVSKLREVLLGSVTEDFQGFEKDELKPYWD